MARFRIAILLDYVLPVIKIIRLLRHSRIVFQKEPDDDVLNHPLSTGWQNPFWPTRSQKCLKIIPGQDEIQTRELLLELFSTIQAGKLN
jgi:hypothetical protein